MSCHYHVFLGPYLEVFNPVKNTTVKRQSCPNAACTNHKKLVEANFCDKCGTKIKHIEVESRGRQRFNSYEEFGGESLIEVTHEGMDEEDYIRFESNIRGVGGRTFYDEVAVLPIDSNTPNAEIEAFNKHFAREIRILVNFFGADAVKIKWGAIAYWS